ncbi:MAG: hypothetical protein ACT4PE_05530 [Candidatus Eiseniibacteriota bacterium]
MSASLDVHRTTDDLKEGLRARKKAPDKNYLKAKYPHAFREQVNPETGIPEWRVGGLRPDGTPFLKREEQRELNNELRPFMSAESERARNLASRRPKGVVLRDKDGGRRIIHPALADSVARKNGWRSGERPRGNRVERGEGGMLWRMVAGAWMPLGVRCLGRPLKGSARIPRRGIQYDPDGRPWRWVGREWTRL